MAIVDTYYSILTCEKLMETIQKDMLGNANMMGGVNSAYEAMSEEEREEYSKKTKQLKNLIQGKMKLLDTALDELDDVEKVDGFSFSNEGN